ncbi:MAG: hypothetical protein K2N48_02005 [Muribaculaceae bacterium]|nr:hypothetical protein [Muribaculaceae bacterium]
MKKIILFILMAIAMASPVFSERTRQHMKVHQAGGSGFLTEKDRNPIQLPIAVYFDSDTDILEVWCDNDNIQAEVFVYDENGTEEAYSSYMNVTLQLTSSSTHSILIKGDGWEGEGTF